ncbi:MAG: 16S rRNA (guanine(966)-N(2))-methyltransferase RsmD [Spirochaetales bacterium]|nr:16S rRNA (guanine(966)-N(2))-methyltransferase RsmD [Spirochaetales bacterium]
MRITGGKYKNRKIQCPPGIIRPAMDRMRESMFSKLGYLNDLKFLDLFSGSGLVGIEAASRGACKIDLVELDRQKKPVILKNISFVEEDIRLHLSCVFKYMQTCRTKYDIIYFDPPFPMEKKENLLLKLDDIDIMEDGCRVIIHYPVEDILPQETKRLVLEDRRQYGRSQLNFYRVINNEK